MTSSLRPDMGWLLLFRPVSRGVFLLSVSWPDTVRLLLCRPVSDGVYWTTLPSECQDHIAVTVRKVHIQNEILCTLWFSFITTCPVSITIDLFKPVNKTNSLSCLLFIGKIPLPNTFFTKISFTDLSTHTILSCDIRFKALSHDITTRPSFHKTNSKCSGQQPSVWVLITQIKCCLISIRLVGHIF